MLEEVEQYTGKKEDTGKKPPLPCSCTGGGRTTYPPSSAERFVLIKAQHLKED